jgi:STE24 endopeptidase
LFYFGDIQLTFTDAFAVNLGYRMELGASLLKLQIQNLSSMDADWFYSSFHHSHPILTERLRAMNWSSSEKVTSEKAKDEGKAVKASGTEL